MTLFEIVSLCLGGTGLIGILTLVLYIGKMVEKIENIGKELDKIEPKLNLIESKLENKLKNFEEKVDKKFDDVKKEIQDLRKDHGERLARIEGMFQERGYWQSRQTGTEYGIDIGEYIKKTRETIKKEEKE